MPNPETKSTSQHAGSWKLGMCERGDDGDDCQYMHAHDFGRGRENAGAAGGDHRGGRGPAASTNAAGVGALNAGGRGAAGRSGQSSAW